jgi:hypothetical protein
MITGGFDVDVCDCPTEIRIRFFRRGVAVWEGRVTEDSNPLEDRKRFEALGATMVMHDCPMCRRIFYWELGF